MAAAPVRVDREAEGQVGGGALDLVDDPAGPDVEELEAAVLARAGLQPSVAEQLALGRGLLGPGPAQVGRSVEWEAWSSHAPHPRRTSVR